ncbi:MAG: hypothetical protein IH608_10715 [Proteobacteria bacterium]|nr:hypothetical protein [Pseudomonadota bacterium]
MKGRNQKGTVLVASMVILALLSLLGASSLLNATLDTQLAANQLASKEAFYAAEAALDAGVGQAVAAFREQLRPFTPGAMANWTEPDPARAAPGLADPYGNPFNGYQTAYRVTNGLDPNNPATAPTPYLYTTVQSGQGLINFAYTYNVEGRAVPDPAAPGGRGTETIAEAVQILETPLVQYYIFFEDHLSWHNGPVMQSWGRVHTNGNLYFAPDTGGTIWFQDYDNGGRPSPNIITVAGTIQRGPYLAEGGGLLNRLFNRVYIRTSNLGVIPVPAANTPPDAADCVDLDTSITPANQVAQEARFVDGDGVFHVRTGVNRLPAASWRTLIRDGFYEQVSMDPGRPDVDGMRITIEGGDLEIWFTPNGGAPVEVTDLVREYRVAAGNPVNFAQWPLGAMTRADNSVATAANPPKAGTMVYSPEAIVPTNPLGVAPGVPYTATGATANFAYPCVLERDDPREQRPVDLTVIDLQRLELWYRDYVDWWDGDFDLTGPGTAPSPNVADRMLLIYVSRSLTGGGFAAGSGGGKMQAIKVIGSRAGRTRTVGNDRQRDPTLTARTTLVSDNPLYIDGDFNAPGASASSYQPGTMGCALVNDATTLLSNSWGQTQNGRTGGTYTKPGVTTTAYNTALFTGRYDFRMPNVRGGAEEAGIHNFARFIESWSGQDCHITGCLINLWFSQQATADFLCCGTATDQVYNAPGRKFGWDVGFINSNYWPPYVPSIYSVERQAWREQ